MDRTIDGYLSESLYPTGFHRQFTPQWIDAMLRARGLVPPRRGERAPFALLDLGCGDGLALIGLAAAHPEGRFIGIDAMPAHVERARAAARHAELPNVTFREQRFAEIVDPEEPEFDYVTAQGVLAWVSPDNREHVRRLCASHLRPGGVACIGYNTLPGWTRGLLAQQLLRSLAEASIGDPVARWRGALDDLRPLVAAGLPGPTADFVAWLDELAGAMPPSYFPHEYLNRHWQPLWAGEEHEAMARHGLAYAGPSRAEMLRLDYLLTDAQRAALAAIPNAAARETALDGMMDQTFRVDLFANVITTADQPEAARLDGWWAAARAAGEVDYELATAARTMRFDTAAARALMDALQTGPRRLRDIVGAPAELLNAVDGLWMTGQILPCEPPKNAPHAYRFNFLNAAAAKAGAPLPALVTRYGILPIAHGTLVAADDGDREAVAALLRLGLFDTAP